MIGIDTGNTAWVLIAAAMVFFMTPGLALFYGGMARSKNVLSTIMQSFFLIGVISVEFMLIGYTLIFGDDVHGIIVASIKLVLWAQRIASWKVRISQKWLLLHFNACLLLSRQPS